ncbi:MAG TPA: hypothetical protein DCZ92_02360 [Elusimicrobia bacterium]|nr:MAG: hypothetical protein A2016_00400 [Elusimicrobia bacterium GWF2_62_30]HBA59667.1 hypothetical protein [Elusimicrobiota bacterium]
MKNAIIIALVATFANSAWAVGNIKLGTVEINPTASIKQSYDSNIYLKATDLKSSLINRSAIGVNLLNKFGPKLELSGGYMLEQLSYSRSAGINDATHHTANLGLKAKLPRDASLSIDDNFMDTTDQATSELTERAQRVQNTATLKMEAPLRGKFGYGIDVQHNYNDYKLLSNDALDRAETLAGFNVSYQLQPKTKVFLGYTYGDLKYDNSTYETGDATYNNIDVGVMGNLAPKLVGIVKAGTQMRNYKNSLVSGGITADDNSSLATYSAQLQWKALEKTEIVGFAKRANVETSGSVSRYYTSTLSDLSASREVRKIKLTVGGSFETVEYPEALSTTSDKKRFDHNTNLRFTAEYNMQTWLKAGLGYQYKNRTSNVETNDYKDNVIGLELKGMF